MRLILICLSLLLFSIVHAQSPDGSRDVIFNQNVANYTGVQKALVQPIDGKILLSAVVA